MPAAPIVAVLLLDAFTPAVSPQDSLTLHRLILESIAAGVPQKSLLLDRRILEFQEGGRWVCRFRRERSESYLQRLVDLGLIKGTCGPTAQESKAPEEWECRGRVDTIALSISDITYDGVDQAYCYAYVSGVNTRPATARRPIRYAPFINIMSYRFRKDAGGWKLVESNWEFIVDGAETPIPPLLGQRLIERR